jgi:hypothetical protein
MPYILGAQDQAPGRGAAVRHLGGVVPTALHNLGHFQPTLVRAAVLRSGSPVLHVRLERYYNAQKAH